MAKKEKIDALVPVEEHPYPVPENWRWVRLGELAEINMGQSPVGSETTDDPSYMPLIGGAADMGDLYPEAKRYTKIPTKVCKDGDIIICIRATLGQPIYSNGEYCLGRGVAGIRPKIGRKEFYWYAFKNFERYLYDNATGSTFAQVTSNVLWKMPAPFAPIAEQDRIVNRIESLFAKLDEAKEKAQAVVDGFEDRKAAILHKAFTGELTEKWRKMNSKSIKEWKLLRYSDLGYSKLGKMLDNEKNVGVPVQYLRNVNVRWFSFDLEDVASMLASNEEIQQLSVEEGDLFICEGGEPGRCAVWHNKKQRLIFQKALHRFRPNSKVVSDYLCFYIYYLSIKGELKKHFTGTTIKHLTGKALAEMVVSIPDIAEQEEIVRIIAGRFDEETRAKEVAEQVALKIEHIKKSILAKAFRGELGTNDPTEASVGDIRLM